MQTSNITRRGFLKGMCVGASGVIGGNLFAKSTNNKEQFLRDFSISFKQNMHFQTPNTLDLWLPLATIQNFQTPYNLRVQGNYSKYQIVKNDGIPLLHAMWQKSVPEKHLEVHSNVKIEFLKNNIAFMESNIIDVPNSLNAKRIADLGITQITHSLYDRGDSDFQKAQKIFAWVATNISSAEGMDTQGIRTIYTKDGKSIMRGENISAACVFASMCNIAGIMATESFGISLDEGRYHLYPKETMHCSRSAIYINGKWIPNDVLLAIYAKENHKDSVVQDAFTQWDNNWMLLNFKRDMELDGSLLSTFQRAYGEIDGVKLSNYDISHFQSHVTA